MHDWSLWRSKINDYLIMTSMFSSLNDYLSYQTNPDQLLNKTPKLTGTASAINMDFISSTNFKIEPSLARFIYYYGFTKDMPSLEPDSYMFYGIPRARLPTDEHKSEAEDSKGQIVTGINVREKVKEFESKGLSASQRTIEKPERKTVVPLDKSDIKVTSELSEDSTGEFLKNRLVLDLFFRSV